MPQDPTQQGDDPALTKRVTSVTPQFFKSLGALIGPDEDNLTKVPFVDDNVPTGEVPDLVTGYIEDISFEGEFGIEPTVLIRQDQPLPMTILSIHAEIETGDE